MASASAVICPDFQSESGCPHGDTCLMLHLSLVAPTNSTSALLRAASDVSRFCVFFRSPSGCPHGDMCPDRHIASLRTVALPPDPETAARLAAERAAAELAAARAAQPGPRYIPAKIKQQLSCTPVDPPGFETVLVSAGINAQMGPGGCVTSIQPSVGLGGPGQVTRLLIQNLNDSVSNNALERIFGAHGKLAGTVQRPHSSYALIDFQSAASASAAAAGLHCTKLSDWTAFSSTPHDSEHTFSRASSEEIMMSSMSLSNSSSNHNSSASLVSVRPIGVATPAHSAYSSATVHIRWRSASRPCWLHFASAAAATRCAIACDGHALLGRRVTARTQDGRAAEKNLAAKLNVAPLTKFSNDGKSFKPIFSAVLHNVSDLATEADIKSFVHSCGVRGSEHVPASIVLGPAPFVTANAVAAVSSALSALPGHISGATVVHTPSAYAPPPSRPAPPKAPLPPPSMRTAVKKVVAEPLVHASTKALVPLHNAMAPVRSEKLHEAKHSLPVEPDVVPSDAKWHLIATFDSSANADQAAITLADSDDSSMSNSSVGHAVLSALGNQPFQVERSSEFVMYIDAHAWNLVGQRAISIVRALPNVTIRAEPHELVPFSDTDTTSPDSSWVSVTLRGTDAKQVTTARARVDRLCQGLLCMSAASSPAQLNGSPAKPLWHPTWAVLDRGVLPRALPSDKAAAKASSANTANLSATLIADAQAKLNETALAKAKELIAPIEAASRTRFLFDCRRQCVHVVGAARSHIDAACSALRTLVSDLESIANESVSPPNLDGAVVQSADLLRCCVICSRASLGGIVRLRCGHTYCRLCFDRYCMQAAADAHSKSDVQPLRCFRAGCAAVVPWTDFSSAFSSKLTRDVYIQQVLDAYIRTNPDIAQHCGLPSCRAPLPACLNAVGTDACRVWRCSQCSTPVCLRCHAVPEHDSLTCEEFSAERALDPFSEIIADDAEDEQRVAQHIDSEIEALVARAIAQSNSCPRCSVASSSMLALDGICMRRCVQPNCNALSCFWCGKECGADEQAAHAHLAGCTAATAILNASADSRFFVGPLQAAMVARSRLRKTIGDLLLQNKQCSPAALLNSFGMADARLALSGK